MALRSFLDTRPLPLRRLRRWRLGCSHGFHLACRRDGTDRHGPGVWRRLRVGENARAARLPRDLLGLCSGARCRARPRIGSRLCAFLQRPRQPAPFDLRDGLGAADRQHRALFHRAAPDIDLGDQIARSGIRSGSIDVLAAASSRFSAPSPCRCPLPRSWRSRSISL